MTQGKAKWQKAFFFFLICRNQFGNSLKMKISEKMKIYVKS